MIYVLFTPRPQLPDQPGKHKHKPHAIHLVISVSVGIYLDIYLQFKVFKSLHLQLPEPRSPFVWFLSYFPAFSPSRWFHTPSTTFPMTILRDKPFRMNQKAKYLFGTLGMSEPYLWPAQRFVRSATCRLCNASHLQSRTGTWT